MSEAAFLIWSLDQREDWATIVCLVGGGQEINTGEAGISEWIKALNEKFPNWKVYISPKLTDAEYAEGKVNELLKDNKNVTFSEDLHLGVSLRSYRAEKLSAFVHSLLTFDDNAADIYAEIKEKYLSTILDVCTHEVLTYQLSDNLRIEFVLGTVDKLCGRYGAELDDETIVHSDQGCHYTSNAFIQKLRDATFILSMSRKGNCWDNAPQESFFGHIKDEIRDLVANCESCERVAAVVDYRMDYYNNDRYQWELEKLSPQEYYRYCQTGVYPLQPGVSKNRCPRGSAPDPEV